MATKKARRSPSSDELRVLLQRFIRDFGLLAQNETPCGTPLAASHAHALMALLDAKRTFSQKDLAQELGIDKSNIARLCRRMELAGHLEQVVSSQDARVRELRLTARGKKLARDVESASRGRFGALLQAIPAADHGKLFTGLELLSQAVRALPTEHPNPPRGKR